MSCNILLVTLLAGAACSDPAVETKDTASESENGDNLDCWQHFDEQSCLAESESCEFQGEGGYIVQNGICEADDQLGWCVDTPWGGATVPTAWYEDTTGRIVVLGVDPLTMPSGWTSCANNAGMPLCEDPSLMEPCRLCLCDTE